MQFACLVYAEEAALAKMDDEHCVAYDASLRSRGVCTASEALQPVRTAATVRMRAGKMAITDGPFTETKEILAGFYLIEAADQAAAIEIASRIPAAEVGCIEVRPVRQLAGRSA